MNGIIRPQEAIAIYTKALANDPYAADVLLGLAVAYVNMEDEQNAVLALARLNAIIRRSVAPSSDQPQALGDRKQ
jgi:tetratricopeptide (TPR) repeat protein